MTLTGLAFQRFNHPSPTADSEREGRWIACDESGWDGEQLLEGRHLAVASVALDDGEAADVVRELREEARIQRGARELKFGQFRDRPWRRAALTRLWEPGGALHGRCMVQLVDKEYVLAAKVIDLLLEEQAHAEGVDLYAVGHARELARTLALQGRRSLGSGFDRLMRAFVAFASQRALRGEQDRVQEFFDELDAAWAASTRRKVTDILAKLRSTRPYAETLHEDAGPFPVLEMLVPAVADTARRWADELGRVSLLTDEQTSLTDERLHTLTSLVQTDSGATLSSRIPGVPLHAIVRGTSVDHPSIQLADLLAGAGSFVANRDAATELREELRPGVTAALGEWCLVPYDDVSYVFHSGRL